MFFFLWEKNFGLVPLSSDRVARSWRMACLHRFGGSPVPGVEDIKFRTEELAQFIDAASERYDFSKSRLIVLQALEATGWVIGGPLGAAVRLGLKRTTLVSKMKKLGIYQPRRQRVMDEFIEGSELTM